MLFQKGLLPPPPKKKGRLAKEKVSGAETVLLLLPPPHLVPKRKLLTGMAQENDFCVEKVLLKRSCFWKGADGSEFITLSCWGRKKCTRKECLAFPSVECLWRRLLLPLAEKKEFVLSVPPHNFPLLRSKKPDEKRLAHPGSCFAKLQ